MLMQKKMEDYDPEEYYDENPDFELPLLSELHRKTFAIIGVTFGEASRGTYALVDTEKGTFRTSSVVLVDRLKRMQDKLKDGISIRVSLQRKQGQKGPYHYFDKPE